MKGKWVDITRECTVSFVEHSYQNGWEIAVSYKEHGCLWSICNIGSVERLRGKPWCDGRFKIVRRGGSFFAIEEWQEEKDKEPEAPTLKYTEKYVRSLDVEDMPTIEVLEHCADKWADMVDFIDDGGDPVGREADSYTCAACVKWGRGGRCPLAEGEDGLCDGNCFGAYTDWSGNNSAENAEAVLEYIEDILIAERKKLGRPFKLGDKVRGVYKPIGEEDDTATIVAILGEGTSWEYVLFNKGWQGGHNGVDLNIVEGCPVAGFGNAHWFADADDLEHVS